MGPRDAELYGTEDEPIPYLFEKEKRITIALLTNLKKPRPISWTRMGRSRISKKSKRPKSSFNL
jgi:hypothetical protein